MPKKGEWPEKREIVLGTVTRVNPFSAFVSLDEYNNKEGMIHISEVAGKWVRDIRKFVKVGQKVVVMVMRVDKDKSHITLSLKRVKKYDTEKKMHRSRMLYVFARHSERYKIPSTTLATVSLHHAGWINRHQ